MSVGYPFVCLFYLYCFNPFKYFSLFISDVSYPIFYRVSLFVLPSLHFSHGFVYSSVS